MDIKDEFLEISRQITQREMATVDSDDVFTVDAGGITYELVCGLEVHAELATATKMFSGAPNNFGDDPNTNVDPVTLGLPGTLPVVNQKAVELAIRFGCAVGGPSSIRRSIRRRTSARRTVP